MKLKTNYLVGVFMNDDHLNLPLNSEPLSPIPPPQKEKKTLKREKEKESRYEGRRVRIERGSSKGEETAKTINLVQESHSINELGDDPGHASFVPRVTDLKKAKDSKNLKKIGKSKDSLTPQTP